VTFQVESVRSAAKGNSRQDPVLQRRMDPEFHRLSETLRHPDLIRLPADDELNRV